MNNEFFRNNLYFKYDSLTKTIDLLIASNKALYSYKENRFEFFFSEINNNEGIYIAPIDLLLYHVESLEFLQHNYSEEEKYLRKQKLIPANTYRLLKYTFYPEDLKDLCDMMQKIPTNKIEIIINAYKNYFISEKKDPVLRILNITTI